MTLFYPNHRPEDAALLDELQTIAAAHPNLTFVPTMTAPEVSALGWAGETRRVDGVMLRPHQSSLNTPVYYPAGPFGMVAAMRDMREKLGVAYKDMRFEEFYGYEIALLAVITIGPRELSGVDSRRCLGGSQWWAHELANHSATTSMCRRFQ